MVSLKEISRFSKCYKFFIDYFKKKNEYYNNSKKQNTNPENLEEDGKEKKDEKIEKEKIEKKEKIGKIFNYNFNINMLIY